MWLKKGKLKMPLVISPKDWNWKRVPKPIDLGLTFREPTPNEKFAKALAGYLHNKKADYIQKVVDLHYDLCKYPSKLNCIHVETIENLNFVRKMVIIINPERRKK